MSCLLQFAADERGQDLTEYSLIITFIAIACLFFLGVPQAATKAIWTTANTQLVAANTAVH